MGVDIKLELDAGVGLADSEDVVLGDEVLKALE